MPSAAPSATAGTPARHMSLASLTTTAHGSHLVQHLYIGAGPLLFPLVMSDLGLTYAVIGLIISLRTFFAGFCQLFYGYLAHRFSRRAILNGSNALSVASSIGMGLSGGLVPFLAGNVLWGLSTSPVHPLAATLTADGPPGEAGGRKGLSLSLFYSYAYVGNLLGAVLVLLLVDYIGWQGVFVAMGLLTLPLLVYGLALRQEPAGAGRPQGSPTAALKAAFADRRVQLAALVGLCFFGGTNVFIRHLVPLYLTSQLHLSVTQAGLVFIGLSVIGIFAPPLFGWIARRSDRKALLVVLASALALAFAYLPFEHELGVSALAVLSLLALLAWPLLALLHGFLAGVLEPALKGPGVEVLLTVNICSFILWASLFGLMIDLDGSFDTTFYAISGLSLISIPLLLLIRDRRPSAVLATSQP